MAINCTWSVLKMQRKDSDGGVFSVYWSVMAQSDGETGYSDTEGGTLQTTPDPSASDYIAYADLTEADVLGWVYNSLIKGDETADEAKNRVEISCSQRVQSQIVEAETTAFGVPW